MPSQEHDYGHATVELTATPWLAHLAGGAAAAGVVLAWFLAVFVAPEYLAVYRDEAVVLPALSQMALQITGIVQGAVGWIALIADLLVVAFLWNRARTRGGFALGVLFAIAIAAAVLAVVLVVACGQAGHVAQDASGSPR
jgi:hypothetical protein